MTHSSSQLPAAVNENGDPVDVRAGRPAGVGSDREPIDFDRPVPAALRGDWTGADRTEGWALGSTRAGRLTARVVIALLAAAIAIPVAVLAVSTLVTGRR